MIAIFDLILMVLLLGSLVKLKSKNYQLSTRIVISLALGVLYGFILKIYPHNWLEPIKTTLQLIGHGYLALLKMLVVPLILTSIIHAIVNLGTNNNNVIKKISFLTCSLLLGTTAISSLIGILVGQWFAVGEGLQIPSIVETPAHPYTGLSDTLLAMIPSNPVASMTQNNTVAVVLFAVLFGIAARMLGDTDREKLQPFSQLVSSLFAIVKKLATIVLRLTPYGIFALISLMIIDQGTSLLLGMLNFFAAMYVAMIIVLIMHSVILIFTGQHPWKYFKHAFAPLFVAFTTCSSFGTLPVTEETLNNKFKTSQTVAALVPSIGATIGMNACAGIFPAMLAVMAMTILHQPITASTVVMIMFINAIASLGISGIPGTAFIAATVTLTSLNLPYAIIALVQGIDPILDMGRTAVNVNATMTTALVVNKLTKSSYELNSIEMTEEDNKENKYVMG